MNQVTIVTGGGRGIGAATARRLGEAGHRVCVGYRQDSRSAFEVVAAVERHGQAACAVRVDTSIEKDVERLFDEATAILGPVTGLVNNAGVTSTVGPLAELDPAALRRVLDVNVTGVILCARRAVRDMSTERGGRGGVIVNISSAAATLGSPGEYVHYAAAKAAVDAFTLGLAKEVATSGIRVNAVAPGTVHTEIHASSGVPDRADRVAARIPMGRAGRPAEIATTVEWFFTEGASYVTGAVLRVAGGL
ncbi:MULTISPECIES: SDR family oxidoreductase [Actinoalloteichus]|uniref:Ketoreductase domain-containing protein n=1 Tax=Actinoalloteichus fjordicus TaxID=1612552 RepID=A0AAC9L9V1_9PSEU|nr:MULTISPECIES: SDR family oxidoreductase [Actinoalloteichus]APU13752.1 dehydrogenase of unknown specificity, short-chain alcohol dehydrogenase like [Actinoalloteichus fjordicus]APU19697.1 dehydrogenase of unknown specificity, short-chain alcohol dehydrogenase like [Actinoalloteichus sp. GBA129-24]